MVPDFGGFITNFHGAVVREQDASILPPRKRLAFNEVLKFDDGLLTSYIALKEGRTREEVRARIRQFTEQASQELRQRNRFRLEHLGSFTLNAERKLVFEPNQSANFFGESYGMTAVSVRANRGRLVTMPMSGAGRPQAVEKAVLEIEPEEVESEEVFFLNSRQRWLTFPNVAASTGIVLLSLVGWLWFDGGNSALSSLNPFSMLKFSGWEKKSTVPQSVATLPLHTPTPERASISEPVSNPRTVLLNKSSEMVTTSPVARPEKSPVSREAIRNVLVVPMRVRLVPGEINASPGRYFVVAGGFGKAVNAQRLQQKLRSQGFAQASLLYPVKSRLIRVAAQEFESAQAARQATAELRSVLGNHVWVLKTK